MAKTKDFTHYLFAVTGGFHVDAALTPLLSASGDIYGFRLPDGREVDIAICLRVEGGGTEEWVTDERQMESLGFESLGYDRSDFMEGGDDD